MRHFEVNALADSCVLKADKQTMSTETSVGSLGRVFAVKDVSAPPPEFQEGEKVSFKPSAITLMQLSINACLNFLSPSSFLNVKTIFPSEMTANLISKLTLVSPFI